MTTAGHLTPKRDFCLTEVDIKTEDLISDLPAQLASWLAPVFIRPLAPKEECDMLLSSLSRLTGTDATLLLLSGNWKTP